MNGDRFAESPGGDRFTSFRGHAGLVNLQGACGEVWPEHTAIVQVRLIVLQRDGVASEEQLMRREPRQRLPEVQRRLVAGEDRPDKG